MSDRELIGLLWLVPFVAIFWFPFLFIFQKIYLFLFESPKCPHGIAGGITKDECEICCKPCIHGIYGGVTRGLCTQCMEICPHGFLGGKSRGICPTCGSHEIMAIHEVYKEQKDEAVDTDSQETLADYNFGGMYSGTFNSDAISAVDFKNIDKMTGYEFEDFICKLYEALGYEVEHTPYSGDGGKDAILKKNGEVYLVECKHYVSGGQIGERDLRIFDSAMHDYKAKKGFYINLGRFKRGTKDFAKTHRIELIGRKELARLIEQADQMYNSDEVIEV